MLKVLKIRGRKRHDGRSVQIGDRFGMLVVEEIEVVKPKEGNSAYTKCRFVCDCGNIIYAIDTNIKKKERKGSIPSCGCEDVKDYIGKTFYKLTVVGKAINPERPLVYSTDTLMCQCECGKMVSAKKEDLKRGRVVSCGCWSKEMDLWVNQGKDDLLIGTKNGFLTIEKRCYIQGADGHNIAAYECTCDCGNKTIVRKSNLKGTKSCGCRNKEDLTGKRFGRLVAIEKTFVQSNANDRVRYPAWRCECDCGEECVVVEQYLKNGTTSSCGCYQRECAGARLKKYNEYDLSGEYGIGYTFNVGPDGEKEFRFDIEDHDLIKDYCWSFRKDGYVHAKSLNGDGKHVMLHRLVMKPENEKIQVDHIKHVLYDNRKSQLRTATNGQNQMNKGLQKNNTSGCPGVYWRERSKSWEVWITVNKKRIFIKGTKDYDVACKAREEAVKKYHGEFSYSASISA